MIRDHRSLSYTLLLCLFSVSLFSSPISVKEVRTQIFEKQVTGYRVTLPHPRPHIRQGILDWLATYQATPASFDDILIYEHLSYPPITQTKAITLYYMIEDVEGVFTQLTLVGMFDYQNSINSTQYPDLTLRMLLDLSKMVKNISQEIINFDPIFSQKNAQEVLARYQERKEQQSLDFFLERKSNQIEDFGETRMKKNPFTENDPSFFDSEDQIVEQIALRFDEYIANAEETETPSPFVPNDRFAERQAFLDSMSSLYQKIAHLQASLVNQQQNLLQTAAKLEESMAEPEIIRDTVIVEIQSRSWKDSLSLLNRDLGLRKNTIDFLQKELEQLQLARKPEVKYVRDTVLVTVMDRQENLVLKIENQSLMDSLLQVRTKVNNQEAMITQLQHELIAAKSSAALPIVIHDTIKVEVPVKDPKEELIFLAERHAWKDSIRKTSLRLMAKTNENEQLREQLALSQIASNNLPRVIHDTITLTDTIRIQEEDPTARMAWLEQNKALEDSIVYLNRIYQRMEHFLEERQTRIEVLQGQLEWVDDQPKIGVDTIFVEVSAKNNQPDFWQDSLTHMQKQIGMMKQVMADRKDRIQQLKDDLSSLQDNPQVIHDTVEIKIVEKAPQLRLGAQVDSLTKVAKHWRVKANSTDSLLSEQTLHIGRLISVINGNRQKADSLVQLVQLQQQQVEQALGEEVRFKRNRDSLINLATNWEWRYEALRDSQLTQGLSPELTSAAKGFQQDFFEDRISQLTDAQKALVQKEWKVESQIKRIQQREKFLADWETDPDQSKLLTRIHELETELNLSDATRHSAIEVSTSPQSGLEIQSVYLFKNETLFQAFAIKTPQSSNQISLKIKQYFQSQSYRPARADKLLFERVLIPELSPKPLDIAFEIIRQGKANLILVSARYQNGTFLSGESGDLDGLRIRRLLYELFWHTK